MEMEDKKPRGGLALILGGEPKDEGEGDDDGESAARALCKAIEQRNYSKVVGAFRLLQEHVDSGDAKDSDDEESDEGEEPKEELDFGA